MSDPRTNASLLQLQRMYRALEALHEERDRYGDEWFAVLAEGPLDEIQRLERELAVLTGRADILETSADLWVSIDGQDIAWPETRSSVLASFLDTLRKGVQSIAEWVLNRSLGIRPTKAIIEACDFRVVGLQSGSLRVGVELPFRHQPQIGLTSDGDTPHEATPDGAAKQALQLYVDFATWAAGDSATDGLAAVFGDEALRRLVATQVKRILPRPRGDVNVVSFSGRIVRVTTPVRLKRATHDRIKAVLVAATAVPPKTYVGDLREIDLDNQTFTLRKLDGEGDESQIVFEYTDEHDQAAHDAIDRRVEVLGVPPAQTPARRGGKVRVEQLTILDDSEGETDEEATPPAVEDGVR